MRPIATLASLSGTGVLEPRRREQRERPDDPDGTSPPDEGDGDGGGGGGSGGGGDWNEDGWFGSGDRPPRPHDPGLVEFAFGFLVVSIGTLFTVFLGAYVMLRSNAAEWPPPGSPGPPEGLAWSTLLLLISDVAMFTARRAARHGGARTVRRRLAFAIGVGVGFVALQAYLWHDVVAGGLTVSSDAYGVVFFTLTGLHAVHVLAGLIFLATVALRARRAPTLTSWAGALRLASWYWHFMDAIWVVLFVVLYAAS